MWPAPLRKTFHDVAITKLSRGRHTDTRTIAPFATPTIVPNPAEGAGTRGGLPSTAWEAHTPLIHTALRRTLGRCVRMAVWR